MDGHLLDTCAVSAYWDEGHPSHAIVRKAVDAIPVGEPRYISRISLAEIEFGILLDEAATGVRSQKAVAVLTNAQAYPVREITRHTAHEYSELRRNIAVAYLAKLVRSNRPRWIENWVDRATGEKLQIDENDLWICAQAREANLVLLTIDKRMVNRIAPADTLMRFNLVQNA